MTSFAVAWPAITAAFLGSFVEVVEAFTIVLAVATVRGWRPAIIGTGVALVFLALRAIDYHRSHCSAHPTCRCFRPNIFAFHRNRTRLSAARAPGASTAHRSFAKPSVMFSPMRVVAAGDRDVRLDCELHAAPVSVVCAGRAGSVETARPERWATPFKGS